MKAIHQIVAGYTNGDAISNEARVMREIFRSWGHKSEIYCESQSILPQLRNDAHSLASLQKELQPEDVVLLHLSMGTEGNRIFKNLENPRVILYHNVTPASFFHTISRRIAVSLESGRAQVRELAGCADIVLADSGYNASELKEMGYGEVGVLPLILDLDKAYTGTDRKITSEFNDGRTNVLFVGRCAPNKKLEDALTAFAYYQKFVNPQSRFIHVGSYAGTERYHAILRTMIKDLQLDHVVFAGPVRQETLNAWFSISDVFLSMSEHEGFCIPLLEAMIHKIPILAYASSAVPETLDGAGVLFSEKDYPLIAETMQEVVTNGPLREAILQKQQERIDRFKARNPDEELRRHLAPLLALTQPA